LVTRLEPSDCEEFVTLSLSKGTPFSMTNCDFLASQTILPLTRSIIKNPSIKQKIPKIPQSCQIVFNFAA